MVILFVVLGFMVLMIISRVIVELRNVQILNVLELELEIGDEGGKLVSLLSSGNTSMTRMEVIGMMYFKEMKDEEKSMEDILKPMLNRLVMLNSTGDMIKEIGRSISSVDRKFEAEVPLPGGGLGDKGDIRRAVRLER